ncbi:MAG: protein phosphatase 2C domain-containing protein [Oscillospiraceae bacterium]|nr:protein phosphatase 2C domain-containing protein [Oscillospiraceae bacterium]
MFNKKKKKEKSEAKAVVAPLVMAPPAAEAPDKEGAAMTKTVMVTSGIPVTTGPAPTGSVPPAAVPTMAVPPAATPTGVAPTVAVPAVAPTVALPTAAAPMAVAPTAAAAPTIAMPPAAAPMAPAPTLVVPTVAAPAMFGQVMIGNAHHIGSRDSQQDSFAISDISNRELFERKGVFCVMADGMGGLPGGAAISNMATQIMLNMFIEDEVAQTPEEFLLRMLISTNDQILLNMAGYEKGGATVVAVIVHAGKMYWISVGDSRIYLIRGGALLQINREHTYAVELDERAAHGAITWEAALGDPQRKALTSYLGMENIEKIDRNNQPVQLLPHDRVLLMSDGVFNALSDEEIMATMAADPHESAFLLEKAVLDKAMPYQDNFTAIILKIL